MTWVYIAVAAIVVTGVYTADAQQKAGEYQGEIAAQNAELDDFRATQAGTIGSIQEDAHRAKVRQLAGTQRADLAANGVDLGSGTAADMVSETYTMGEADALTIRFNAMNESWGYRTSAVNNRNDGRWARTNGKNQATGTYLSTAASVFGMGAGGGFAAAGKAASSSSSSSGYGASTGGSSYGTGPA